MNLPRAPNDIQALQVFTTKRASRVSVTLDLDAIMVDAYNDELDPREVRKKVRDIGFSFRRLTQKEDEVSKFSRTGHLTDGQPPQPTVVR